MLLTASLATAQTQLQLDGSLPNGRTDDLVLSQVGPNYEVSEDLGWRAGTNLFHSFAVFDIGRGDRVTFTSDPLMPDLSNVIARVTGGEASDIEGVLASTIATADLYLLNPAGILFSSDSSIDVQRSLYLSTAHRLDFANTMASLDLLDPTAPTLSVESPEAFGFYADGPRAAIGFANPEISVPPSLRVPDGETISIVGGDVHFEERSAVRAFSGRVQVVAAGGAEATITLDAAAFSTNGINGLGQVRVEGQSRLDALQPFDTSVTQGTVVIRGGQLIARDRVLIQAGDENAVSGASIDIETSESVTLEDNAVVRAVSQAADPTGGIRVSTGSLALLEDSVLRVQALSFAPVASTAGGISIDANAVSIESGARIDVLQQGPGTVGGIEITANEVALDQGFISTETTGSGSVGGIHVDATGGAIRLRNEAAIFTQTSGASRGGDIDLRAATIEILGDRESTGASLRSTTIEAGTSGSGRGGDIRVEAGTLLIGRGEAADRAGLLATVVESGAIGDAGSIDIHVDDLTLNRGGQISSTTLGAGDAGAIEIIASDHVEIRGDNVVDASVQPSGVFASADTNANGNDISIEARSIRVRGGAGISTRALGSGRSGDVTLLAEETIRIEGFGEQGTVVTTRGTNGPGGNVTIEASLLEVLDGASVDVSSIGSGTGGRLRIEVDDLRVAGFGAMPEGGGDALRATLAAQADSLGDAAGIEIRAEGTVSVEQGGQISVLSRGLGGSPGDIDVEAARIEVDGGLITAEAGTGGVGDSGGDIRLAAREHVRLRNAAEVTARSSAGGNAGTIAIAAPIVDAIDSSIIADADAFGGNIEITAEDRLLLRNSNLLAESRDIGGGGLAGGNIILSGDAVVINPSSVIADGFGNANGGNIVITADAFLLDPRSTLSASSELGIQGTIEVNAPNTDVTGELSQLPASFLDASAQLAQACLARDAETGTFAVQRHRMRAPPDALFTPSRAPVRAAAEACEVD